MSSLPLLLMRLTLCHPLHWTIVMFPTSSLLWPSCLCSGVGLGYCICEAAGVAGGLAAASEWEPDLVTWKLRTATARDGRGVGSFKAWIWTSLLTVVPLVTRAWSSNSGLWGFWGAFSALTTDWTQVWHFLNWICIMVWGHVSVQRAWRSEENSLESFLSFHLYVGFGDHTQVVRLVQSVPLPTKSSRWPNISHILESSPVLTVLNRLLVCTGGFWSTLFSLI